MTDSVPLISIIIPVKNGAPWLHRVLTAISKQTLIDKTEIIVIDSGSTDDSLSIVSNYNVRVVIIDPGEFNHGTTRNRGVREAKGTYVVMTVQDAIPVNEYWLQFLLDGFDDEKVAGVCGLQIVPHELDKNPVDWFRPISSLVRRKFYFENASEFERLLPQEKKEICSWDNVNAMYDRVVLLSTPFQNVSFAEDALWAREILMKGHKIVYNPMAQVSHYHYETANYTLKRSFTVYYHFFKFFQVRPNLARFGVIRTLRTIKLLLLEPGLDIKSKFRWMIYNYRQQKAIRTAVKFFYSSMQKGENELDSMHIKICNTVPQAPKPNQNKAY